MQMSRGPSCPINPIPTESSGTEINTQVQHTLAPEDVVRREAHHVCSEWLQSRSQRIQVEGDSELMCPWVIDAERTPASASALANQNILHPFQVSLKGKGKRKLAYGSMAPFEFPHFLQSLSPQGTSRSGTRAAMPDACCCL
jgi:hypothetical protein